MIKEYKRFVVWKHPQWMHQQIGKAISEAMEDLRPYELFAEYFSIVAMEPRFRDEYYCYWNEKEKPLSLENTNRAYVMVVQDKSTGRFLKECEL